MAAVGGGVSLGAGDNADDPNVASQLARAILAEVNVLRRDPTAYADQMSTLYDCYKGNSLTYPQSQVEVETTEGSAALQGCLEDLRSAAALPTVMMSQAISKSCAEHVSDLGASGECSHVGADGSTPEARLARAGEHREQCGENVVFGMRSAKEVVYHMLLDDGAPERGHRANLLNPDFRFAGVAFGSHPSAETAAVVLFTDHFRARAPTRAAQMKNIAEDVLGVPAEHTETGLVGHDNAAGRHWDALMQEMKPAHLRVPQHLHAMVQAHDKPKLYRKDHRSPPTHAVGALRPLPAVDPAIVRAFVHRIDADHDGSVEEDELLALSHQKQLDLSPEELGHMFDEVLSKRQRVEKRARGLKWNELGAAVQLQKCYVPVVDVNVELEGKPAHVLTVEIEDLLRWSQELYSEFSVRCPGLSQPPRAASAGPRNTSGSARVGELSRFLKSVVAANLGGEGGKLQDEPKVQNFFGAGLAASEEKLHVTQVVCMSCRRLWAFHARPFRERWLELIRAAGLDPLVPLSEKLAAKTLDAHMDEHHEKTQSKNLARTAEATSAAAPAVNGKMKTREPPQKVQVRDPNEAIGGAQKSTTRDLSASAPSTSHWEEKRMHTESLVNQVIKGAKSGPRDIELTAFGFDQSSFSAQDVTSMGYPPMAGGATASEPQLGFTFDARRKFQQVLGNQNRASDERRFLGAEKRAYDIDTTGGARRTRGTGAHSTSAPAGTRGHFHNSIVAHAADGGHHWPQSMDVRLDGEHIDHSRAPELKPDPKYSKMDTEERGKHFSCYFGSAGKAISDPAALKMTVAADQSRDLKPFSYQPHEHRHDVPHRHGKFGRRAFDAQVREKPVCNPGGISEIEHKPTEEFRRQQELVGEFLDRRLPDSQPGHFKTHLPKAENAHRYEEMATREKVNFVVDGGLKRHELGFFQNRHTDHTDMKLHTRGLGASHMDRKLPMA